MSATAPWSVKGIDPRAREIAKDLARRSGMTLGEWLNSVIMDGPEEDGEASSLRRPAPTDSLERRNRRRSDAGPGAGSGAGFDASELNALIFEMGERLEETERRSTSAIQGIDQAVASLMRRIETDRDLEAKRERRLDDIGRELRDGHQRLRTLETRAPDAGSAQLSELSTRLDQAQDATRLALQGLERSFAALDQKIGGLENQPSGDGQLAQLVESLRAQIETNRQDMIQRLDAVSDKSRMSRMEQALALLHRQTQAAEQRSARAVEAMGHEIMRIARNMNGRMETLEQGQQQQGSEAVLDQRLTELGRVLDERLDREIARHTQSVETRLTRHEDQHALALERLGGEITRISDRLSERIAQTERRSTQAIDDISRRLSESSEKLERRTEEASGELSDRLRQSEERTRKLLEEAKESRARREAAALNAAPRLSTSIEPSSPIFDDVPDFITESTTTSLFGTAPAPRINPIDAPLAEAQASAGWADTVAAEMAVDPFPSHEELRPFASLEGDLDDLDALDAGSVAQTQDSADTYPSIFASSEHEAVEARLEAEAPTEAEAVDSEPEVTAEAAPESAKTGFDFADFLTEEERALVNEQAELAQEEAQETEASSDNSLFADASEAPVAVEVSAQEDEPEIPTFLPEAPLSTRDVIDSARAAISDEEGELAPRKTFGLSKLRKKGGTSALQQKLNRKAERESSTFGQALKVTAMALLVVGGGGYGTLKLMRDQDLNLPFGQTPSPADKPLPLAALALDATPTEAVPSKDVAETEGAAIYARAVVMLDNGDVTGVEPLKRAAELGYVPAQMRLAAIYTQGGSGLEPDPIEARQWVRRAAEAGEATAMQYYATQLYDGVGGDRDEAGALEWMRKSAEAGRVDSQYNVAHLYEKGVKGVAADKVKAFTWYMIAARRGDNQAREAVQRMTGALSPDERRTAIATADDFNVQPVT